MNDVVWHDLECGAYRRDLPLWLDLARAHGSPVLDIGAGTGRVAVELARHGYEVVAVEHAPELARDLRRRVQRLSVDVVEADARTLELDERFPLCLVPMQTIQLLGGVEGRARFLRHARAHLLPGGVLAIAIAEQLELFEVGPGQPGPLPDMEERDGFVYASTPTAVRAQDGGFVLERRREVIDPRGARQTTIDHTRLDAVSGPQLAQEGRSAGLRDRGIRRIPATRDHVGSAVVMLSA